MQEGSWQEKEELHPIGSFCSTAVTEGKKSQRTYDLGTSTTIEWPPGLLRYVQDFMETDSRRGLPRGILENLWVAISKLGTVCGEASIVSPTFFWKVCLHVPSCQACLCSQTAWMPYQDRLWARGSSELTPMSGHKPFIISFHIVCWRLVPFVFGKPILCSTENLMRGNMVYPGSEAKLR